jgi:hypothetical protein
MEGEGAIGLAVEEAAGPLVNRDEASVAEDCGRRGRGKSEA